MSRIRVPIWVVFVAVFIVLLTALHGRESSTSAPIHILLTSAAQFNLGVVTVVNSTLTTSKNPSRLRFHIVSSNKAEANEIVAVLRYRFGRRVAGKLSSYGLAELGDSRLAGVKVWDGNRSASLSKPIVFARYLAPALLPSAVERVIYLDQDVLVQKDIAGLWDVDLEGYPLAAARRCHESALWGKQFVMEHPELKVAGFDDETCMLNNGVLVYDLAKWRAKTGPSYTDELFEWTRKNSLDRLFSLGSQPPFNLVFYRNYKVLDDRWNLMDIASVGDEGGQGSLPETRSQAEVSDAAILHWNGPMKPWMCDGEGYYSELWTAYFPSFRDFTRMHSVETEICGTGIVTKVADPPSVEKFTVVIVAFARVDTIIRIAKHLQRSAYLHEIIVAWNNQENPCPAELSSFPWVRCIQQKENLVHNRFLVWSEVQTEAVLHYDDDLIAPLEDLEAGFQIWRSHRDQVLGFEPRVIDCKGEYASDEMPRNCKYHLQLRGAFFDIVIGKLFFISRGYMRTYFDNLALVGLSQNYPCEDIAINFHASLIASSATRPPLAPLLFKSNLTEVKSIHFAGLSQQGAWGNARHDCVQRLLEIYHGRRPGPQTSYYEHNPKRRQVHKFPIRGRLDKGWCSDSAGSRSCRPP